MEQFPSPGVSALDCERVELRYIAPSQPGFARNYLTDRLDPPDPKEGRPAPKVTLYAQPTTEGSPLDLVRLAEWLEPNARRYEPNKEESFVPPTTRRGIVDGVLALEDYAGEGRFRRFIALRRTGTIEYGAYCTWSVTSAGGSVWVISLKTLVLQVAHFLALLEDLGATFETGRSWKIWCNARCIADAFLAGFGTGRAEPFQGFFLRTPSFALEDRFQLSFTYGNDPDSRGLAIGDFARRFDFAFGSLQDRARDRTGDKAGAINFAGVTYQ